MNNFLKRVLRIIKQPKRIIWFLGVHNLLPISDKFYLESVYECVFNEKLDLDNPKTFDGKLQWLKLYNRKDIYTTMVDKYAVKEYAANIIGEEYIIPTIGIYEKFDDIDFDKLPNQFVIKCTHDSGGLVIVKDKSKLDLKKAKKKINKSLKTNYYYAGREWPYKNVKPRIIIEKYMEDKKYKELRDYKVYAFNGECDYVMLCFDRFNGGTKFIYFDKNWNMMKEFTRDGLKYGDSIKVDKPKNLDKMFEFAKILSKGIPFLRVDFYEVDGKLYLGELTFYPSSGFDDKRLEITNKYLTSKLKVKNINKK